MPDPGSLTQLREVLRRSFDSAPLFGTPAWTQPPRGMALALKGIQQLFGTIEARPAQQDILAAVRSFAGGDKAVGFVQLKHVCYGVGSAKLDSGETLVNVPSLLQRLFSLVEALIARPKQFRRCYQGLLDSYFRADADVILDAARREVWRPIRSFLARHVETLRRSLRPGAVPLPWVTTLEAHSELLGPRPGERFATCFATGELSELREVSEKLSVSPQSWIWQEALLAYIDQLIGQGERRFRDQLSNAVQVLSENQDVPIGDSLRRAATARLASRYAACQERPEHAGLRDLAIHVIGHPWLDRSAWDAHFKDDNARRMVESWLKRRLMTDFFELLAHDGAANPRRLAYWLKFEKQGRIEDVWFCLGENARYRSDPTFKEVRKRMAGREIALENAGRSNNAFIMKFPGFFVVEFGETGNACFIYSHDDLNNTVARKWVSVTHLKRRNTAIERLTHLGPWESTFDGAMSRLGLLARDR